MKQMVMFYVRREVLSALFSDPKWSKRVDRIKTLEEAQNVIAEFCRERGYRVAQVQIGRTKK